MKRSPWPLTLLLVVLLAGSAYLVLSIDDADDAQPGDTGPDVEAADCIVRLHGRGGNGAPDRLIDGVAELRPTANSRSFSGFAWAYGTPGDFDEALTIVDRAVARSQCVRVVVTGFSNGGAMAAKVFCSGATFDGRLVGVLVDDPVPDAATVDCRPGPGVAAALYWTGGLLPDAVPGADCTEIGYICEGTELIGIEAMGTNIGVPVLASPFTDHIEFVDAPEPLAWLSAAADR